MPFQTGGGNIAKLAYDESQEAKQSASTAITSANEANAKSDFTQKQLDQVAGASTIDPAVEQMKVDTEGTTHASPDARLRSDYNKVTSQLAQIETDINNTNQQIENLGQLQVSGVYETLTALQSALPNGGTGVYVVSADGHWYYWNGTTWVDGGVFQSTQWLNALTTQDAVWSVV